VCDTVLKRKLTTVILTVFWRLRIDLKTELERNDYSDYSGCP
jgi:hypothetical protein